jgi:outer membrane biosynthesis protein TonB
MIQLTLTFISVEAARAALLEIPASALVGGQAQDAEAPKPVKAPKAEKAPAPAPAPTPEPKPAAVVCEPETPAASTASSSEPSASVDYPTLQKAVFALAGKSREAAAAVAASMKVKTFKELDRDAWAGALVAVNAKMAELEAA